MNRASLCFDHLKKKEEETLTDSHFISYLCLYLLQYSSTSSELVVSGFSNAEGSVFSNHFLRAEIANTDGV